MRYAICDGGQCIEADDFADLERRLHLGSFGRVVRIRIYLPISLAGTVARRDKQKFEEVVLDNLRSKKITLRRRTGTYPEGNFGVRCDFRGDEVPLEAIYLSFQDPNTPLIDQGLLWVRPGDPAFADFDLCLSRLKESRGSATDLITAAEGLLNNELLRHFE